MKNLLAYIKSRTFFVHLGLIMALTFLIIFGAMRWLSGYTEHGEFVVVPDFKGQKISGLENFVKDKQVSYQIIDSIYDPQEQPGIVLRQDPENESKVKHNRKVYLYVTGMVPPQIVMPKLVDRSERQAKLIISSYGLKVGRTEEKHADCNGCVLDQLMGGKSIKPGSSVPKGSVISLVIGRKDGFMNSADTTGTLEQETE